MNAKFFVPYQTAKLLKKKGYPQGDSDMYYTPNGELKSQADIYADLTDNDPMMYSYFLTTYHIAAPAYHEVVDWLEGKGIYICIEVLLEKRGEFVFSSYIDWIGNINQETHVGTYPTREEALNAGILAALKKL